MHLSPDLEGMERAEDDAINLLRPAFVVCFVARREKRAVRIVCAVCASSAAAAETAQFCTDAYRPGSQ